MTLVVFDVDGTLVDSQAQIVAAMQAGCAGAGVDCPPRAEVLAIVGLSLPRAIATLLPGADAATLAEVDRGYRAAWVGGAVSPLFPGVPEMLARLAERGVPMALATGKSRRGLASLIAGHGWEGMFAAVECADDHPSKPHPAMLLAACDTAGVAPEDAVMVGDTSFDMDMARAAGVRAWAVDWGYHPAEALVADRRFATVGALAEALEALA